MTDVPLDAPQSIESAESLLELCWDQMIGEPLASIRFAEKAISLTDSGTELHCKALSYLGLCYFFAGEFSQAIDVLNQTVLVTMQQSQAENTRRINNALGMCYHSIGQYQLALQHYDYAAEYSRKNFDDATLLAPLINTATLLLDVGNIEASEHTLTEVMGLDFSGVSKENQAVVFMLEARLLINERRFREADQVLEQAEALCDEVNYCTGRMTCQSLRGKILRLKGQPVEAIEMLTSLIENEDVVQVGADGLAYYLELAKSYFDTSRNSIGIDVLKQGLERINPPRHNLHRLKVLDQIAHGYRLNNDVESEVQILRDVVQIERSEQHTQDQGIIVRSKIKRQHEKSLLRQELKDRENQLLKESHKRLSLVNDIAHQVGLTLSFRQLGDRLYEILKQHLDVHFVSLVTLNPDGQALSFRFVIDDGESLDEADIPMDSEVSLTVRAVKTGKHVIIHDSEIEGHGMLLGCNEIQPRTMLFMPLLVEDQLLGVFSIQSPIPHRFGKNEIELMLSISKFIGVSVSNILSHEEVQKLNQKLSTEKQAIVNAQMRIAHMAYHDSLTSLPNRQSLEVFVERRTTVQKRPFNLIYIDLDGFKPVNDHHGHRVGDEVLVILSQRISESLRNRDFAARVGGDEFVLVVDEFSQPQDLQNFLKRLLNRIEESITVNELNIGLSASIGIARYPDNGQDLDSLMHNADSAMYKVKRQGKGGAKIYLSS